MILEIHIYDTSNVNWLPPRQTASNKFVSMVGFDFPTDECIIYLLYFDVYSK